MMYFITLLAMVFCLLITNAIINKEGKKEMRQLSVKEEESFEKALANIHNWNDGIYNPIIKTENNMET